MSDGPPFDSFYTSQALEDLEYWSKTDKRIRFTLPSAGFTTDFISSAGSVAAQNTAQ